MSERSNAGFLKRTTVACRQPFYAPGQVLLSNKLHLTAADPQCQLLVTAHKHTHSLEGPSRPLVRAGGLFLLRRAYVNIGFATDRKILVFEHLKQFPAYLNWWDSQQARNEGVLAY